MRTEPVMMPREIAELSDLLEAADEYPAGLVQEGDGRWTTCTPSAANHRYFLSEHHAGLLLCHAAWRYHLRLIPEGRCRCVVDLHDDTMLRMSTRAEEWAVYRFVDDDLTRRDIDPVRSAYHMTEIQALILMMREVGRTPERRDG